MKGWQTHKETWAQYGGAPHSSLTVRFPWLYRRARYFRVVLRFIERPWEGISYNLTDECGAHAQLPWSMLSYLELEMPADRGSLRFTQTAEGGPEQTTNNPISRQGAGISWTGSPLQLCTLPWTCNGKNDICSPPSSCMMFHRLIALILDGSSFQKVTRFNTLFFLASLLCLLLLISNIRRQYFGSHH